MHLIGKRIAPLYFGVYVAKPYLRTTRKLTELSTHVWIALDDPVPECAAELWLLNHPDLHETTRVKADAMAKTVTGSNVR